jgi:hypothetical protein
LRACTAGQRTFSSAMTIALSLTESLERACRAPVGSPQPTQQRQFHTGCCSLR